jgi:4-diphosphocytidyl-2-C-methyl-D-erythritol kinase
MPTGASDGCSKRGFSGAGRCLSIRKRRISRRSSRNCGAASRTPPRGRTGAETARGEAPITLSFTAVAPAKINLFLHVVGRRTDGYHELDSLIAFADAHDVVRVEAGNELRLTIDGPFAAALRADEDNLVLRAARALAGHAGVRPRAAIALTKNLPVASGIGGGSADAAATLRALKRLWALDVGDDAMASLGLTLGADVPACLLGRTARVQGIGERLAPFGGLPETGIVLVNPGVAVATRDVFLHRSGNFSAVADLPPSFSDASSLVDALSRCRNDLAAPARSLVPAIGDVLGVIEATAGCLLARLSGSGATCFGLFADVDDARAAAAAIGSGSASWWVHAGRLVSRTPSPRQGN